MISTSKTHFILSALWTVTALLFFLWLNNSLVGIVWLCGGLAELVIALVCRKKERKATGTAA